MKRLEYIKMLIVYLIILMMPSVSWAESKSPKVDIPMVTKQNVTRFIFTPDKTDLQTIHQYIKNRHQILDKLASERPEQVLDAQISFRQYLNSQQLIEVIKHYDVKVLTLNFGWKDNGGEVDIAKDESIEEALIRTHSNHKDFVEELYESASELQKEAIEGMNEQDRQREDDFFAEAKELKDIYEKHGVLYYGIKVIATASKLKAIKDTDTHIRLVDPLWDERESLLGVTHKIKKIGIPISPHEPK